MTPTKPAKPKELFIALANLAVLAIVAAASTVSIMRLVNHFGPVIGDVIAFGPAAPGAPGMDARIVVARAGTAAGATCVLDLRAMRTSGGSVMIEAMQFEPAIGFRAHWAGGRTGEGETNCGTSAELRLTQPDLVILRMGARRE